MASPFGLNTLERAIAYVAPQWAEARAKARVRLHAFEALGSVARAARPRGFYDAASRGPRVETWRTPSTGPNSELRAALPWLIKRSHDLMRNDPWARKGVGAIVADTVAWGISFQIVHKRKSTQRRLEELAARHLLTTKCDADGRHNIYGLQALALRVVAECGACIIRRRRRRASDGLPVPVQFQVLEPEHIDMAKDGPLAGGGYIVQGIQFDKLGQREGYWLFTTHPGEGGQRLGETQSHFVSASEVTHIYRVERGSQQVHGIPWLSSIVITLRDYHDFDDAKLLTQKLAACMGFIETTPPEALQLMQAESTAPPDPGAETQERLTRQKPLIEDIEPGMHIFGAPGNKIDPIEPPSVADYGPFTIGQKQKIAAGLEIPYEVLSGDYSNTNFSGSRMGRLGYQTNIEMWRWQMLIPGACEPMLRWFLEASVLLPDMPSDAQDATATHSPPPFAMLDPSVEVPAKILEVAGGMLTPSEMLRQLGYEPERFYEEYGIDLKTLAEKGIVMQGNGGVKVPFQKPAAPAPAAPQDPQQQQQDGGGNAG